MKKRKRDIYSLKRSNNGGGEIRRAVPLLADQLHMSRASIYHYLKGISSPQADEDQQNDR
ncbi:helix-turn-helix domain-containing protein [Dictyobacter alpinus]|uniref:helix-turn-helix domain-containing protein n=1 Tax=Dictyobacter alpinus TaxID=2014873 RepID=UPI003530A88F